MVDHCHVQSSVLAMCPVRDEDISWPGICPWQQGSVILGGGKSSRHSCLVQHIPEMVVSWDPLAVRPTVVTTSYWPEVE